MRDVLIEVLKQSSPFSVLKVVGTPTTTTFLASSDCKTFLFKAVLTTAIPEFEGEFGISNISLLSGLLNFAPYRTDESTLAVKRRKIGEREIVEQVEFAARKGSKSAAIFRFTSPELIPEITSATKAVTWDVEFTPDRSKIAELQQLAGMYGDVAKTFIPATDGSDLVFHIGTRNASTHNASMIFQDNVTGEISGDMQYNVGMFNTVMKMADKNAGQMTMALKTRSGPMKVTIETAIATYEYMIRASR